jgi:hypothetical protein
MTRIPAIGPSVRHADRGLYVWAALTAVMIVFAGFARTYYLKSFFGMHQALAPLVHLHGFVMTLWFTLFAVQVWLVRAGRVALHRKLGLLGALLAAAVVGVGTLTAITSARLHFAPGVARLAVLSVTLGDLVGFSILVPLSLVYRHCPPVHKRLVLLASLSILTAAVARIPLDFINTGSIELFFCLVDLCILACIGFDTMKNGRLHPALLWGCLFVVAEQLFRVYLSGASHWLRFATWLVE